MKKLYILLFSLFWLFGFSQSYQSLLSNIQWKIIKIQWNGNDHYAPAPFLNSGQLLLDNVEKRLSSSFYNSSVGAYTFGENNADYFTLSDMVSTLAVYYGENEQAVQNFDGMATDFYMYFAPTDKFHFDYQETSTGKTLVVTNPAGNKIFYSDALLAANETSKTKISVYPNPASDFVIIENLKTNSIIEVIDNSGKLLKTISNKSSREEIDIKRLTPGIYYLKTNGKNIQKIIKK